MATRKKALKRLSDALGARGRRDEPLALYTNIRIGGAADLLTVCHTTDELVEAVRLANECAVPWRVLGGGCNVLVADAGFRGLVVINRADRVRIEGDGTVWAESGAMLSPLARETVTRGLVGLEWAAGLPGTVGGAVVGNAGAFGGDVASCMRRATVLEPGGQVVERASEWFEFVYRGSRLKSPQGSAAVVLAATFGLQPGDPAALTTRVTEILEWRRLRHPHGATMGSTFKNAPDAHAGRLIDGAGLKGYTIGGAEVSTQHANFFINTGRATAADVRALIEHVQREVERRFGVRLEPEIELVGEW
ncbi:MAG: UDP-N-acetylmuramate dehydrogenase [Anaerolineae bacterium]|nr:UDP-N-acetylmuramate dehydrogenase [Anaerolineae bacterium]